MARRAQHALADGSAAYPTIVADGSTPSVDWEGGNGTLFVVGTVGSGTYALQQLAPDGTTWSPVFAGVTAAGQTNFLAPAGKLRLTASGSTTPSIKAWVVGIPTNNGG